MPSAAEIERYFATGAETFTFTREEWESFYARQETYSATKLELMKAQDETARVKRVARPLWRAVSRVRRGIARALERHPGRNERLPRTDVQEWALILALAQQLDWKDLPAGHRRHAEFKR